MWESVAMTKSLISVNSSSITILITLYFLISPSCSLNHKRPPDTLRGSVLEEKTRLGSGPPSCYNKCNQCSPCMAEQVPTLPSHNRVQPRNLGPSKHQPVDYFKYSSYSNYKPLGWKCRCGAHFYNP